MELTAENLLKTLREENHQYKENDDTAQQSFAEMSIDDRLEFLHRLLLEIGRRTYPEAR